jgi:hypothetical protein
MSVKIKFSERIEFEFGTEAQVFGAKTWRAKTRFDRIEMHAFLARGKRYFSNATPPGCDMPPPCA